MNVRFTLTSGHSGERLRCPLSARSGHLSIAHSISTAVLVRQVLGAIAQFEKANSVAKLAAARKRKREREGRCEGRKPHSETKPEVVAIACRLRRKRPKGAHRRWRAVSRELTARSFLNERGKPFVA